MQDVVIAAARRTPIGKFLGSFADVSAAELGGVAVRAAIASVGLQPDAVDELIFGCARQAGNGPNIARQIVRRAGLPDAVPAFTVNKACASGIKAIALAHQAVALGEADVVVAGGTENMTRVPFLLDRARLGYRLGHSEVVDDMYRDGFLCPLCSQVMGDTAETLADRYAIGREEQDRFAAASQNRCEQARAEGRFKDEIAPVALKDRTLDIDEHPRDGVTAASLAKLPPVFRKAGTVHAGNSSGITDGAAAVVVMSAAKAMRLGIKPMARIAGSTRTAIDPAVMGLGPVSAVRRLEERTNWRLDSYDVVEINEAFAAQVLACDRELKFDWSRTNVNGGSIALGHPIGATGARIVVTALHELKRRGGKRALATLCVSGGLGMAIAFEAIA